LITELFTEFVINSEVNTLLTESALLSHSLIETTYTVVTFSYSSGAMKGLPVVLIRSVPLSEYLRVALSLNESKIEN